MRPNERKKAVRGALGLGCIVRGRLHREPCVEAGNGPVPPNLALRFAGVENGPSPHRDARPGDKAVDEGGSALALPLCDGPPLESFGLAVS